MRLKKKCEHLLVDSWHVPSQEARELVRRRNQGRYGLREHVRAELSGSVSRWVWPGLLALLTFGIFISDWWLIIAAAGALFFFAYQGYTLVRVLGSGEIATTTSRRIEKADADDRAAPLWHAIAHIDGSRREIEVTCEECIDALRAQTCLELAVLIDPDDADNHWLVGFREK